MPNKKYRLDYISERVLSEAKYLLLTSSTLKKTATFSNTSTSTIYRDLNDKLPKINAELYREVRLIIERNKKQGFIKKAEIVKQKFLIKK